MIIVIHNPLVVHCLRSDFDVYIGREHKRFPQGSIWGNPFHLHDESKREEVLQDYFEWLKYQDHLLIKIPELKGKRLGCHCYPKLCHGLVLADLANGTNYYLKGKENEIKII